MSESTSIGWCDSTFNPWWGCTRVSPGCDHCYAARFAHRYGVEWGAHAERRPASEAYWQLPRKWNRKAKKLGRPWRVFCGSMCDVFEPLADLYPLRERLWETILQTPHLTWMLLTKRPGRIRFGLPVHWDRGWPNVWLGVSVEDSAHAWRVDVLRRIPAAVRFISAEPLLGPLNYMDLRQIDWLVCGGETGPGFRSMQLDWARGLRDRCRSAGVPCFFKQHSGLHGRRCDHTLDGVTHHEWPEVQR